MNETFYKPLTPSFRQEINDSIGNNIAELCTCNNNALANMQKVTNVAVKNLINGLPDGYLIPMEKKK